MLFTKWLKEIFTSTKLTNDNITEDLVNEVGDKLNKEKCNCPCCSYENTIVTPWEDRPRECTGKVQATIS